MGRATAAALKQHEKAVRAQEEQKMVAERDKILRKAGRLTKEDTKKEEEDGASMYVYVCMYGMYVCV